MIGFSERAFTIWKSLPDGERNISQIAKQVCEEFGIPYVDSYRKRASKYIRSQPDFSGGDAVPKKEKKKKPEPFTHFADAQKRVTDTTKKVYIITAAQNATPVHDEFWQNLLAFTEYLDASLHVIALRYKNPTSVFTDERHEWWAQETLPYLDAARHNIHPLLTILADVKTQPTAVNPLSGFESITGDDSCIIGHTRQHLQSLPVLPGEPNKLLLSTGVVTVPNYTDSKAGKKGEFHHHHGFAIVEIDDSINGYHIRLVNACDDGSFQDLDLLVSNGGVTPNQSAPLIVMGDLHHKIMDKVAVNAQLALARYLRVKDVVIHDAFDATACNPHDQHDPFRLLKKESEKELDLHGEIMEMVDWFNSFEADKFRFVVVRSNHDDMVDRWLMNTDWRKAPNKKAYLSLANMVADTMAEKGVIPAILSKFCQNVLALGINDSFKLHGVEYGLHGHIGISGARPSPSSFRKLPTKLTTAHTHAPMQVDGWYRVGTSTPAIQDWQKGPSPNMQGCQLSYHNGKRQLIHLIKGKFTTRFQVV